MNNSFVKHGKIYIPRNYLITSKPSKSPFDEGVYLPLGYKDIYGVHIPINEIINKLSKFRLSDVIKALIGINLFLRVNGTLIFNTQKETAETFLSTDIRKQIDNSIKELLSKQDNSTKGFVLFHSSQLLLLIQKAFLVCSSKSRKRLKSTDTQNHYLLGELCLMVGDYIHDSKTIENKSDIEKAKDLAAQLLLTNEIDNEPKWTAELARSDYILSDFWITSELNPSKRFYDKTSLTIDEFRAFVFGLSGIYEKKDRPDGMLNFAISTDNFLQNTQVPMERFNLFLKLMSKSYKDLPNEIYKSRTEYPEKSFITFRKYPIFRFHKDAWCANSAFLMERATTNLFWQIHDILSENERDIFHRGWGYAFQKYVVFVLDTLYPPKSGAFYASPKDKDGNELADGLLYDGRRLAILEYKGVPLSIHQKYRGNERELFKALETKLFSNTKKPQLAKNINRIYQTPKAKEALKILRIDMSKVQVIIPLIICNEQAILSPFIHDYLQHSFQQKAGNLPNETTNLCILHISGLEKISSYKGRKTLLEIVEEKSKEPIPLARSLDYKIDEILKENNIQPKNTELDKRSNKILSDIGKYFFGTNNN